MNVFNHSSQQRTFLYCGQNYLAEGVSLFGGTTVASSRPNWLVWVLTEFVLLEITSNNYAVYVLVWVFYAVFL